MRKKVEKKRKYWKNEKRWRKSGIKVKRWKKKGKMRNRKRVGGGKIGEQMEEVRKDETGEKMGGKEEKMGKMRREK